MSLLRQSQQVESFREESNGVKTRFIFIIIYNVVDQGVKHMAHGPDKTRRLYFYGPQDDFEKYKTSINRRNKVLF